MKDIEWEADKAQYINKVMASFQKHFGKNSIVCPDCSGPSWYVCEKIMRETLAFVIDAGKRETDRQVQEVRGSINP